MKKILVLMLATVCVFGLVGCGSNKVEEKPNDTKQEIQEVQPTPETPDNEPTINKEIEIVKPLDETINLEALEDSVLSVSFEKEDIYKNEDGTITLNATIHTYDIYDMVKIANLKKGDTILVSGEEVTITTIEQDESGAILINGGIDNDGITFVADDETIYYIFDYNDAKVFYELGKVSLQVAENFVFHDESNLENPEITYSIEDLLKEEVEFDFYFVPNNATIRIEDGKVVEMVRIFTP